MTDFDTPVIIREAVKNRVLDLGLNYKTPIEFASDLLFLAGMIAGYMSKDSSENAEEYMKQTGNELLKEAIRIGVTDKRIMNGMKK